MGKRKLGNSNKWEVAKSKFYTVTSIFSVLLRWILTWALYPLTEYAVPWSVIEWLLQIIPLDSEDMLLREKVDHTQFAIVFFSWLSQIMLEK